MLALSALIAACSGSSEDATRPARSATPDAALAGPITFSVLAGHSEGAIDIERFMPADIHVREGDSIEWTSHGIEGHTISFVSEQRQRELLAAYLQPDPANPAQQIFNPDVALKTDTGDTFAGDGTYVNSGFIGVPAEATYELTFAKLGVYQYICLVHPFTMRGVVSVDAPDAAVDAPDIVAARGQSQLAEYIDEEKRALSRAGEEPRELPAADGATVHHVAVGVTTPYGQVAAFVHPTLDINPGDTVIFENDDRNFHNIVFRGSRADPPPGIGIIVDPGGRGMNFSLDAQSAQAVDPPPGGFDDTTFLSSGSMGILQPRLTWRLTFDKPGTYVYNCTIHVLAGMAGVINVH